METDPHWVEGILDNFPAFLQDHANCERKASALALSMVVKYPDRTTIIPDLIALAREELEHFEEVYRVMNRKGILLAKDEPDPYINGLLKAMRHGRQQRFIDRMLVSSLVECRGAERFRLVADAIDDEELGSFYHRLWKSEQKHGNQFIRLLLKEAVDEREVMNRAEELAQVEADLVLSLPQRAALH